MICRLPRGRIAVLLITMVAAVWAAPVQAASEMDRQLGKAKDLMKQGRYAEAQKYYKKTLDEMDAWVKQEPRIRSEYEALNMKFLFSRQMMPESIAHQVEEGETLSDIAKKYRTTVELLKKSNGLKTDHIQAGKKLKVVQRPFAIRVDKSDNELTLLLNQKPFKHYKVATGKRNITPTGTFKIINKVVDPTWYKKPGQAIPPGTPENHLGTRWLGFDKPGYGIHGTVEPHLIGQQVSSGCVRMKNEDVEELYVIIPQGTLVNITN